MGQILFSLFLVFFCGIALHKQQNNSLAGLPYLEHYTVFLITSACVCMDIRVEQWQLF